MKRRHVLLRSLYLVIFIGTGELFETGKATQGWVTVKSLVKRCQRMEIPNFRVKRIPMVASESLPRADCCIPLCHVCVDWPLFALPTTITGVNVCVDWPLFALPTTITGVNVCVDWPLFALPTTITGVNVCVDWPLFALPTTITGVNVCVDWPLFALPTTITGVNVCVDWPLFALPTTTTGVNVCVDWPLFALPTSITGDYHPPETPIVYHRVRKCKFSKCRIAYYPNATATRRILLLSGDIEVNPGWEMI